jgi:hypothetical protein
MKTKNILKRGGTYVLVFSLTLFSCSDETTAEPDTQDGESASQAEVIIEDAVNVSNETIEDSEDLIGMRALTCNAASLDMTNKTITLDFGNDGCVGADNRLRKGKITINYVGTDVKTSTTRTLTFTNYSVNGNTLNGSIAQTTIQRPTATSFSFTISATNLSLVLSEGEVYNLSSFQRTFLYEYGSINLVTDNVITITGSSTQSGTSGGATTLTILNPITMKGSCTSTGFYYPVSGSYQLMSGSLAYTIDWGTGTCDKELSITVLGRTTIKTLP